MTSSDLLTTRALNRATMARQMLLERAAMTALAAIERLCGLQAQAPQVPYVGLWTRLDGFDPEELSSMLADRRVVRIALMRNTVHLVSADDCLAWRPLVQPIFERDLRTNTTHAPALRGLDPGEFVASAEPLLRARPRSGAELRSLLAERWPERDPRALAHAARALIPLVQVPPRGLWRQSGQPVSTSAEHWLDRPFDPEPSIDALVLRHLAAFGPATVADVQMWSGLTRLGEVVDRLRSGLRTFRDERGRELFDLPDAPRPDPDTPVPTRFLPAFDNLTVSYADRSRVISEERRKRLATSNGMVPGTVLVDGVVSATWKVIRRRDGATLAIELLGPLSSSERAAVVDEGRRLLAFVAAGDTSLEVRVT